MAVVERQEKVITALARLRRRARLTQRELGERMGVDHSTVASFERAGANPRLNSLLRYLDAVGATVTDLAREVDGPDDPVQAALDVDDQRLEDEPLHRRETREDLARFGTAGSAQLAELKERIEKLEREVRGGSPPGGEQPLPNGVKE